MQNSSSFNPATSLSVLVSVLVFAVVPASCRSSEPQSALQSGDPSDYAVATFVPQVVSASPKGSANAVKITQILQLDGGLGYQVLYRGSLLTDALAANPAQIPDITLTAKIAYSLSPEVSYTLEGIRPTAMPSDGALRFYLSSTCIEGNYGGCKTAAPADMAKALAAGLVAYQTIDEALIEVSFSGANKPMDDLKGLNYKMFFAGNKGHEQANADSPIHLAGNVLLSDFEGGVGLGCYGQCGYMAGEILVNHLGFPHRLKYPKSVGIGYQMLDKNLQPIAPKAIWDKMHADFLSDEKSHYERWNLSSNVGGGRDFIIEFAVFYEVNGQTYWDNNGRKNYIWDNSQGRFVHR